MKREAVNFVTAPVDLKYLPYLSLFHVLRSDSAAGAWARSIKDEAGQNRRAL